MNKRILGGLAAAVMLAGGLALTSAGAVSADVDHCPDHTTNVKVNAEVDGELNGVRLESGTQFCVKGSTGNSDIQTADGLTLIEYMAEFAPLNNGGQVPNVSYYVIYEDDTPPPPPSGLINPPVLTASFECVADSASSLLTPASSTKWTAGPITEDKSTDTFSVDIRPAEGSYFADLEGSITLTAEYPETSDCEASVAVPSLTPPSCQAAGGVVAINTAKYTFGNVGNIYTATAVAGVRLVGQTVFEMQPLPKLNTGCAEVTQSEPPIPPTVPTQRPAPDVVFAFSPAQARPAEVSALPPVAPAAGLPVTGIDGTGITAIIALLLTSLGGAALFAARRRDASI